MVLAEARIFFQICLPLSLPGIATITLLTALGSGTTGSTPFFTSRVTTCIHCNICLCKFKTIWTTLQKSVGMSGQLGSCSTKRNRSYGHGCSCNCSNRDSLSILPTLLCKRFDDRWCERIETLRNQQFLYPSTFL